MKSDSNELDVWDKWSKIFCDSDGDIIYGSLLPVLLHWIAAIPFTFIDMTGKPAFLFKYKIEGSTNRVPWSTIKKIIKNNLFNQFIAQIPYNWIVLYIIKHRDPTPGKLPTIFRFSIEIFVFIIALDVAFYYIHRIFHTPLLYKQIHKQHHEFKTPISIVASYCHPIDHCVMALTPTALGPLIISSNMMTTYIWFNLVAVWNLYDHSGFHFPFLNSNEAHDYHHLKKNAYFGLNHIGLLDRIHGTDSEFRKSRSYERHRRLLSLVPIRQLFPDKVHKSLPDD